MQPTGKSALVFACLMAFALVGCQEPAAAKWDSPPSVPGGEDLEPGASFVLIEVAGKIPDDSDGTRECEGLQSGEALPANVSTSSRSLSLPPETRAAWRQNGTIVIWDRTTETGCSRSELVLGPNLVLPAETTIRPMLTLEARQEGARLGGRFLEAGDPYIHEIEWQERNPLTGEKRALVVDLTITSRGIWDWDTSPSTGDAVPAGIHDNGMWFLP